VDAIGTVSRSGRRRRQPASGMARRGDAIGFQMTDPLFTIDL
jgi:hypothetical protein